MFNARVLPRPEGSLWLCSDCIMQRKSENVVIYFSFVGDKRQRSTRQVTRHVSQKEKNAPSVLSLETLPAEWETTRQRTTFGPLRMNPERKGSCNLSHLLPLQAPMSKQWNRDTRSSPASRCIIPSSSHNSKTFDKTLSNQQRFCT